MSVPNLIGLLQAFQLSILSKSKVTLPESTFRSTRCLNRIRSALRSDWRSRDLHALSQPPGCDMADQALSLAASAAAYISIDHSFAHP